MKGTQTVESLAQTIALALGADIVKRGEEFLFQLPLSKGEKACNVQPFSTVSELHQLLAAAKEKKADNGIRLYDDHSYEVAVRLHRLSDRYDLSEDTLAYNALDAEEGITYTLGPPSKDYIVLVLQNYENEPAELQTLFSGRSLHDVAKFCDAKLEKASVFDCLQLDKGILTLRIAYKPANDLSHSTLPIGEFEVLAASLIFQLSYNLDVAITEIRQFEDLLPAFFREGGFRSSDISDIQVPKRRRIPELVYFYQAAISSESPAAQFLSFYHVVEYFFDEVFEKHSVKAVREALTRAGFSVKRDADISSLIDMAVKGRKLLPSGAVSTNEKEALQLTLKDYVKLDAIRSLLSKHRGDIIRHYKENNVPFVKGDTKLDLEHADTEQVIRKLANRIYMTRNAVVHSKGGSVERYVPFRHDKDLSQEVPLIRAVAEEIIEASSTLISYGIPF